MFKDEISVTFLNTQKALWANTEKLADMIPRVSEFDAIFYVGGHGRTSSLSEKQRKTKALL
jgi:putative intracellular protease/amidase